MPLPLVALVIAFVYALHQDIWLWRSARPLVLGFLPAGLAYHAGYTLVVSLLMIVLVKSRWPGHLEDASEQERTCRGVRRGEAPR